MTLSGLRSTVEATAPRRYKHPRGSIGSERALLRRMKNENLFHVVFPHLNLVEKATVEIDYLRRYYITLKGDIYRYNFRELNVNGRNLYNNNFVFQNYFMAWAYLQKYRIAPWR